MSALRFLLWKTSHQRAGISSTTTTFWDPALLTGSGVKRSVMGGGGETKSGPTAQPGRHEDAKPRQGARGDRRSADAAWRKALAGIASLAVLVIWLHAGPAFGPSRTTRRRRFGRPRSLSSRRALSQPRGDIANASRGGSTVVFDSGPEAGSLSIAPVARPCAPASPPCGASDPDGGETRLSQDG